jgi:dienelactone hydrolase
MNPRTVVSLLLVLASAAIAQNSSKSESQKQPPVPRVLDFKASEGVVLKGTYFAAAKPGPGVILYHQSNRTRESWSDVARLLAAAGINVLTVDSRAHGESGGESEKRGGEARKTLWPQDLDAAFDCLVSQPDVTRNVVGIGGAGGLGVDNSVETARRHPEVKSLVLISGETLLPQLQFLRRAWQLPGLFIVSDDDEYPPTVEAMEWLYDSSSSPGKQFIHYVGPKAPWVWYEPFDIGKVPATGSHGTDLFSRHPDLHETIVSWFVNTLIKTPGHAPADAVASAAILNEIQSAGGVVRVTERLLETRKQDPQAQLFPEVNVDIIAEDHQREGDNKTALEIFKLNVLAYPDSADANGNLADAYLRDGQKDLARKYAQKALALLDSHVAPASSWSDTEQRRSEIRKAVEDVLKKLKDSK